MPGMETNTDHLTHRYERIMTRLFETIWANNRVFPTWLTAFFDRLMLRHHCRANNLLCKLFAGRYRPPHARTTPRTPPAKPAAPTPKKPPFPAAWKWLTRALPSPMCEAARACADELQHFLAEPEMRAAFAAAPALRTHLRPLCRALGVTLPAEPPPSDPGPEPEPPPAVPLPIPEPGWTIKGRTLTPAESREIDRVASSPGPRFRPDPRYFPFAKPIYR